MKPAYRWREFAKRMAFGPASYAQQFPIGLTEPQEEITVRLHGRSGVRDVTRNHVMACGAPFTIGIGIEKNESETIANDTSLSLQFYGHSAKEKLFGSIDLRLSEIIPVGARCLHLFQAQSYENYCLPKFWLWTRYLHYAYLRARGPAQDVRLSVRELHSMFVFYICPRSVVLGGVTDGQCTNVFPMNLMGTIGDGYFSFALNSERPVTSLVKRTGRVALSSIPFEKAHIAFQLGKNHKTERIELGALPFATNESSTFGFPVPEFALRVREMQIESAHSVGSHTLFIARTIRDERKSPGEEMFVVHGIYQAARHRAQIQPAA